MKKTKKQEKIEKELKELKNLLVRTQADFINYKRRVEEEKESLRQFAADELILKILPVLDSFDRAFRHIPKKLKNESWVTGVIQIEKHLQDILTKEGVEKIESLGKIFDPTLHEALTHEKSKKHKEEEIIEEYTAGYKMHGKIIRPAKVKVARHE